jgi:hypothetical protein
MIALHSDKARLRFGLAEKALNFPNLLALVEIGIAQFSLATNSTEIAKHHSSGYISFHPAPVRPALGSTLEIV